MSAVDDLSSSTIFAKPNAYKFNGGTELTADFGWQMYDTPFRSYDAQLGRFHQMDPLADSQSSLNPYHFGYNNPISLNDPTGLYEGSIQNIFDEAWARTPGDVGFFHFDNGKLDRDLWAEGGINYVLDFVTSGEGTAEFMMDSGGGGYWLDYNRSFVWGAVTKKNAHLGGIVSKRSVFFRLNAQNRGVTDFTNSNMALTVGGAIYGAMEGATAGDRYWLGKNGKYYTNMTGRGPNRYTGSRTAALNSAKTYRLAGRATIFVSAGVGVYSTIEGIQADGGEFGYNAQMAAFSGAGSIAGGIAGAKAGAAAGAFIGAWFGGVGAIPGAVIGGFIGGVAGSFGGSYAGRSAVNYYHGR